jgi:glutathione S-transferase
MRLFGFSPTRTTRPMWALAELDIDYEAVTEGVFKHPELKKHHPLGRLPVMDIDGRGLFESAAICTYLADLKPDKGLISPSGSWERAMHDQWTSFALTEMEAWGWSTFRSENIVPKNERVPQMYDYNLKAYLKSAELLEKVLEDSDYLISDRFSVTDIIVGWTCHFTTNLGYNKDFDNINAYVARLMARPKCALPELN